MNLKHTLLTGLCSLGAAAGLHAQALSLPGSPAAPANVPPGISKPAAPATTYSETQILEVVGWVMGKNSQIETFDFNKEQLDAVVRGFISANNDKNEPPIESDKIGSQVSEYVQKRQDAYKAKVKAKALAESDKLFTSLKTKSGVVNLASGLAYEILKQGAGPTAKLSDTVRANYTGKLSDGTVFSSTFPQPPETGAAEPAEFALAEVLPGWSEGLQKINKGGSIRLYVPAKLGYGDDGREGIPPGSALIFDLEIIDIKPTPGPGSIGPVLPGMGR